MSYDFADVMGRIQAVNARSCELCPSAPKAVMEIGQREILVCNECAQKIARGDLPTMGKAQQVVSKPGRKAEVSW